MTQPQQPPPPAEQVPPPPPPTEVSPQAAALEEALAQAEGSLAPVIAGIVIAAVAAEAATPDLDDNIFTGASGVAARTALMTPTWIVSTALNGLAEYTRGNIMMILQPIVLGAIRLQSNRAPQRENAADYNTVAHDAVTDAVDHLVDALRRYITNPDEPAGPTDFYDDDDDPRSAPQRRAESFARRTARWLAREAVFRAQETLAPAFGYKRKRWLSERDTRVRAEHAYLDGKTVGMKETFQTPTGSIRYPGDITAPLHLVINCRCSLEWLK